MSDEARRAAGGTRARTPPSVLRGAAWGSLVAVVSAVVVVLGVVGQDAAARAGSVAPGPGSGVVVLTLVVAAVGAAVMGAVIGVLSSVVVRWRRLGDRSARAAVVLVAVLVVVGFVATITQGAVYSGWLWAMVPVAALAGVVLARRLVATRG